MTQNRIGLMLDNENLDLGAKGVITQVGVIAFPLDDPETELRRIDQDLPVQPQLTLGRTMSFSTILWWMQQDDKARARFIENTGNDMEELLAFVRSIHRKISELIQQAGGKRNVEVWAKGPQMDIVQIESLFNDCGLEAPWDYDTVMDLRTTMKLAGIHTKDVDSTGIVPHVAVSDCKFQIRCYAEAMKHLRANS